MNNKLLVIVGALALVLVSIGGFALAQESNDNIFNMMPLRESTGSFRGGSHCNNNEDMVEIMRENGFEDMANAMEERDYAAMDEFMNNLTDEEYEQMLDVMDSYGYGNMARMMENVGREGMIDMHNSMMGGQRNSGFMGNMMRGRR